MQLRVRRTLQIAALCASADHDEKNRRNSNLASCSPCLLGMGDSCILFRQEPCSIPPKRCDGEVFTCTADHVGPCGHLLPCQSGGIAGSRAHRLCHARAGRRPGVGMAGGNAKEREKQRRDGGTTPKERGAARCLGVGCPGKGAWRGLEGAGGEG